VTDPWIVPYTWNRLLACDVAVGLYLALVSFYLFLLGADLTYVSVTNALVSTLLSVVASFLFLSPFVSLVQGMLSRRIVKRIKDIITKNEESFIKYYRVVTDDALLKDAMGDTAFLSRFTSPVNQAFETRDIFDSPKTRKLEETRDDDDEDEDFMKTRKQLVVAKPTEAPRPRSGAWSFFRRLLGGPNPATVAVEDPRGLERLDDDTAPYETSGVATTTVKPFSVTNPMQKTDMWGRTGRSVKFGKDPAGQPSRNFVGLVNDVMERASDTVATMTYTMKTGRRLSATRDTELDYSSSSAGSDSGGDSEEDDDEDDDGSDEGDYRGRRPNRQDARAQSYAPSHHHHQPSQHAPSKPAPAPAAPARGEASRRPQRNPDERGKAEEGGGRVRWSADEAAGGLRRRVSSNG
jgi:hypothetical protein